MERRGLVWCGLAAAVLCPAVFALGAALRPAYDPVNQTVSALVARGAPNRLLLSALLAVYGGLLAGFGLGVRRLARRCGPAGEAGVAGGGRIVVLALLGLALLVLPTDTGGAHTAVGAVHLALAAVMGVLAAGGALGCGLWWRAVGLRWLARLSVAAAGLMALAGLLTLAAAVTDTALGLAERLLIGAYLLWMGGAAVGLARGALPRGVERRPADGQRAPTAAPGREGRRSVEG